MNEEIIRFAKKGRPEKSVIRDNIKTLLKEYGPSDGYSLYKVYIEKYPKVTMRSIYYHLKKGVELELFRIKEILKDRGSHSWGNYSEKIIYEISE
jgi:hypothetical protein